MADGWRCTQTGPKGGGEDLTCHSDTMFSFDSLTSLSYSMWLLCGRRFFNSLQTIYVSNVLIRSFTKVAQLYRGPDIRTDVVVLLSPLHCSIILNITATALGQNVVYAFLSMRHLKKNPNKEQLKAPPPRTGEIIEPGLTLCGANQKN